MGSIALVATATLAQGINLPAEIVIIAGDDRYNEDLKYRQQVPPHELLNAAGRAGRAGQSSQGAVILIPGEIVTIKNSKISDRWWTLKKEVFSKADQCLIIEDPIEYFLDSLEDIKEPLSIDQINFLYRFKAANQSETKKILKHTFYAYKAIKQKKEDVFNTQVENLISRRNELDALSEDIDWIKEISFKTGISPTLIMEISNAIDEETLLVFINFSVVQYIDWFFDWLKKDSSYLNRIFTKPSTIEQIKKAIGIKPDVEDSQIILEKILTLKELLLLYIKGNSIESINKLIPESNDKFLTKGRNFSIRLIPESSFGFWNALNNRYRKSSTTKYS